MRRLVAIGIIALGGAALLAQVGPGSAQRSWRLAGFDQVDLRGRDDVNVHVGPGFSVVARGPQDVLDHLDIFVKDGVLKVGRRRSGMWGWGSDWSHGDHHALVTVTLPALRGASVAGSGTLQVDHARAPQFGADIAGSGNLRVFHVEARTVAASIAGSGSLALAGQAEMAKFSIAGSGDIQAGNLRVRDLNSSTAGSGDIEVSADRAAKISIMGSGDVRVHGPAHCEVSKMGSGDAKCG